MDKSINYDEIIPSLEKIYVPHPNIERLLKKSLSIIKRSTFAKEPKNIVLTGYGGMGKTTFCKAIVSQYPEFIENNDSYVINKKPVLNTGVPSGCSIRNLVIRMLESMKADQPTKGTQMELTIRLKTLLQQCGTKVIILDELQHLKHTETYNPQPIIDWIKDLINQIGLPIIAVGMPKCEEIIRKDNQVARRFPYQFNIRNLGRDDFHGYFNTLLKFLIKEYKFSCSDNFLRIENTLAIYAATGGNPGDLSSLIFETIEILSDENKRVFSLDLFKDAADGVYLANAIKTKSGKSLFDQSNDDIQKAIDNHVN